MAREQKPIRLRETKTPFRRGALVIDARFTVVKRRKGILLAIGNTLLALALAAVLGALATPAWALIARFF